MRAAVVRGRARPLSPSGRGSRRSLHTDPVPLRTGPCVRAGSLPGMHRSPVPLSGPLSAHSNRLPRPGPPCPVCAAPEPPPRPLPMARPGGVAARRTRRDCPGMVSDSCGGPRVQTRGLRGPTRTRGTRAPAPRRTLPLGSRGEKCFLPNFTPSLHFAIDAVCPYYFVRAHF